MLTDTGEDISEGIRLDDGVNGSWGQRGVQAEQVRSIAGNVRGSHGGSRDGIGSTVVPSGDYIGTYGTGEVIFRSVKGLCVPGAQMSTTEPKLE